MDSCGDGTCTGGSSADSIVLRTISGLPRGGWRRGVDVKLEVHSAADVWKHVDQPRNVDNVESVVQGDVHLAEMSFCVNRYVQYK